MPRRVMKEKETTIQKLESELETYQSCGISLLLEGRESSPASIVNACMVAENGTYMRDYIQDERGMFDTINFNFVSENE